MRVAVVGTGGVANRHLGVLALAAAEGTPGERLEVVGHVSADPARANAQAGRWGGQAFDSLEALLGRARPEAVWLCVTPDRHGPPEEQLIERGVPFFVEKPLAADLATAERIADRIASPPGLVVGVGYKYRALDTLPRVRDLLAERPARLVLGAWHDTTPPPAWWRDERRSGGQVVEQATHLVDLARLLLGEGAVVSAATTFQPRAAYPDADVPQVTAAMLRFGGVPAVLTTTCLLHGRQAIHLQIVCEGRVLTLAEAGLRIETGSHTEEIPTTADPFLREDAAFLRAVRQRRPEQVLSTYADALRTHRLCIAIREQGARWEQGTGTT